MRTGRRRYTAETPASLLPEALTMKPIVQAPSLKAKRNQRSKDKKKKKNYIITGLWDVIIPSELLQEILSRLGPKANIQASVVCKTWFEAAVSVRKLPLLPWLFYPLKDKDGDYILFDPLRSQKYEKNVPDLKDHGAVSCSRDGWLLVVTHIYDSPPQRMFFFNPFTQERIYLPNRSPFSSGSCLAFSAAPTSTSCLVISFSQLPLGGDFVIATWRPGETVWTVHRYWNLPSRGRWNKCVFSNGVFYALSLCGYVGVFDPSKESWDVLPVIPWHCPGFCEIDFSSKKVFLMEHDGNIFVMSASRNEKNNNKRNRLVFRLNLERMVWEDKSDVCGGLTVFASYIDLVDVSAKERNGTYPSSNDLVRLYNSLFDEMKNTCPPTSTSDSNHVAWVDPSHNNVNL
ncbi:unnamed protein product [Microthlaspi erraticum]|uniref:Uncharacterized protein n=1 Tax=Microthlaspi erraticum TaxID=1685480 RepID=A0A6D2I9L5_9BRAS|nr:unnamed protein product [Microthlaspi erraticum]